MQELNNIASKKTKTEIIVCVVSAILLLLAIPEGLWEYSYYTLLRWIVFGTSIYITIKTLSYNNLFFTVLFIVIAIFFNPLIIIHTSKEIWIVIDFISAGCFLSFAYYLYKK